MTRVRSADVRLYVDADILGLARLLAQVRPDVTFPGDPGGVIHKWERPACPIADPAAKDVDWLPIVADRDWLIITRDIRLAERGDELAAVHRHRARVIALSAREARSTWNQLEVFLCRWRAIERCFSKAGPFIYIATRIGLWPVDLSTDR